MMRCGELKPFEPERKSFFPSLLFAAAFFYRRFSLIKRVHNTHITESDFLQLMQVNYAYDDDEGKMSSRCNFLLRNIDEERTETE